MDYKNHVGSIGLVYVEVGPKTVTKLALFQVLKDCWVVEVISISKP